MAKDKAKGGDKKTPKEPKKEAKKASAKKKS